MITFSLKLPGRTGEINLSEASTFPDKMRMVYKYVNIKEVFCQVKNTIDMIPPPVADERQLKVEAICIRPADPHTMVFRLRNIVKILRQELKNYVRKNEVDSHLTIKRKLEDILEKCKNFKVQNDVKNRLRFKHDLKFKVRIKKKWYRKLHHFLDFDKDVTYDIEDQLNVRMEFYNEMTELIERELSWHKNLSKAQKPYTWDSPRAELEVSELFYCLTAFSQRVTIDEKAGGSLPKFRKQFFEIFGLNDSNYVKKTYEIRSRKKNEHFINEMLTDLNSSIGKIKKIKK